MLRPIPMRILTHSATLLVPTQIDMYQNVAGSQSIQLSRVHFQNVRRTIKGTDNTEIRVNGTLYIDAKLSMPQGIDFAALSQQAEQVGAQLKLQIDGDTLTVIDVDAVPDDTGALHHWEVATV